MFCLSGKSPNAWVPVCALMFVNKRIKMQKDRHRSRRIRRSSRLHYHSEVALNIPLRYIVIGTSARQVAESHVTSVDLGDVTALTSDSVKSLGVALDDTLSFQKHINAICQSTSFHLRALSHIRNIVSEETAC